MAERRILAVTSSTAVVGVAAGLASFEEGGREAGAVEIVASEHVTTDRRHAEELTPMIEAVLGRAGWKVADVDTFAVDVGPGRFTGLRVGLATVRTLALAADRPVVGVSSLELLAAEEAGAVCAVIDARRSEVFQQRFVDGSPIGEPAVGPASDLAGSIDAADLVVGDGADRYAEIYQSFRHVEGREPQADVLARLAATRPAAPGPTVEPLYLRGADVQINIKTRHNT